MTPLRTTLGLVALAALCGLALADAPNAEPKTSATGVLRGRLTIDGKSEFRRIKWNEAVINLVGDVLTAATPPPPAEPAVMDQKDIAFVPHVLPVVAGATIEFRNTDACMHNIHAESDSNPPFNLGLVPGKNTRRAFPEAEVIEILCNVHAEMKAWIVVLPNAFFAQPSKEGEFRIPAVPPGTYKVRAWLENFAPLQEQVTIRAGEETEWVVNFDSAKRLGR
ncbi:MAG: carboxypeptidase regulatory-like domain-containing protein [Planctomycetes bacterium]|nr:carboxypeptidase regulatory-like domain-containing protein [Planctomycetota bacterium]